MVTIFHGVDEESHEAFQVWRQSHPDGFHMSEGSEGMFTIHWTQDKRENTRGRGCHHQGGSLNRIEDDGCYTASRKVCSDSFQELIDWAKERDFVAKPCFHCNTKAFPFPGTRVVITGSSQ